MSGFTPGPWEIGADDQNGQAVVRAEHIEIATCWHHCVGSLEDEMRHNARLIAASPTMFEYIESSASAGCATARKIISDITGAA